MMAFRGGTTIVGAPGLFMSIPLWAEPSAGISYTNMPAAESFYFTSGTPTRAMTRADLSAFTQVRLVMFKVNPISNVGATIGVKYISVFDAAIANWSEIGSPALSLALDLGQNVLYETAWSTLVVGARGDVLITPIGTGGDGIVDPGTGNVSLQVRVP